MIELKEKEVKAQIYNFKAWITETEPDVLFPSLDQLLHNCGYTVLNHVEHHFPVKGYTCLWLLGESHLAIHTFPEENVCYVELSGCNRQMNDEFRQLFTGKFEMVENR